MQDDRALPPPSTVISALAHRLKARRIDLGLTQEELADRAGLNPRHVQKLEAGELNVTIGTLASLALALDVTITDLLEPHLLERARPRASILQRPQPSNMLANCRNTNALVNIGLTPETLCHAITHAHMVLDSLDERLTESGLERLGGGTVELANLSSIVGNLLGAGIALHSGGRFNRNRPHTFPDLLPSEGNLGSGIEIKVALEKNRPKGHLAKSGIYLTFRYVLMASDGFNRQKRGDIVAIWEARCGFLSESDFSLSNTAGDSGKTAVIKTLAFRNMSLVYFDKTLCPYNMRPNSSKYYVDFN